MITAELRDQIEVLVKQQGCAGLTALEPCAGGRNNRAWIALSDQQRFFVKQYFHHPEDPRDRLGTERAFLDHCGKQELHCVPRMLASHAVSHLALFEFIQGSRVTESTLSSSMVEQALTFLMKLQPPLPNPSLPNASEATWSIEGHLHRLDRRLSRLLSLEAATPLEQEVVKFIGKEVQPLAVQYGQRLREYAKEAPAITPCKLVSPSDFGFHNALLTADGTIFFIDFEYAGYDDPAKTVLDFFLQPQVPVPQEHFDPFMQSILSTFPEHQEQRRRIAYLRPIYVLIWTCMQLQEFVPNDAARRHFALGEHDAMKQRESQLIQARSYLRQKLA